MKHPVKFSGHVVCFHADNEDEQTMKERNPEISQLYTTLKYNH